MSSVLTLHNYQDAAKKISVWVNPSHEKRPRLVSFIAAFLFHAVLFFAGGALFVHAPEYGLDTNRGGVDIYLVAAPENFISAPQAQPEKVIVQKAEMDIPAPKPVAIRTSELKKSVNAAKESVHRGDGSSLVPGESATTLSSAGSGFTEAKPGYLKNEPPAYPSPAVEKGQEGLVLLSVAIDRAGRPQKVDLKQSSGFSLLDGSAIKAVKKWKFSPARMGALAVDTQVTIPVRFRLQDVKKK